MAVAPVVAHMVVHLVAHMVVLPVKVKVADMEAVAHHTVVDKVAALMDLKEAIKERKI